MNINSPLFLPPIEQSILEIANNETHRCRQTTLPLLRNLILEFVPGVEWGDIVDALKALLCKGKIVLTKPDHQRFHASLYSGVGDEWFYGSNFNISDSRPTT